MKNKKIYTAIIVVLFIFEFITLFLMFKSSNNDNNSLNIKEYILSESEIPKDLISLFIEREDGSGYDKSNSSTWPSELALNTEMTSCVDKNGNKVTNALTIQNGQVKLVTDGTIFCDLYFNLDSTAPVIKTVTISDSNGYTKNTSVSVTISWDDNDVTHYCMKNTTGSSDCTWNSVTGNSTTNSHTITSSDGTKTVYAYLKDKRGNVSTVKSDSTILDTVLPTCTLQVTTSGISFKTKSSDATSYGMGTTKNYNSGSSLSLNTGTYYGYVKDYAGNENSCSATLTSTSVLYNKTTTTCQESSTSYSTYTCSKSYDACTGSWENCSYCVSDKCRKSTGSVTKVYSRTLKKCDRSVSGYTKTCYKTYCPYYKTSSTCTRAGCVWKQSSCSASTSSTTTSSCSYTISGSKCIRNVTSTTTSCPTGWTRQSYSTNYKYSFGGVYDGGTVNNSCTVSSWSCTSSMYGSVAVATCSGPTYSCSSGTYPNTGSYCYTYGGYTGCSSGTASGGKCYKYDQTSCGSGWSSTVSSTTYTYSYSPTSSTSSNLTSCSSSTGYSSCSGSYSSSQSSMKNKVNVTCTPSSYTCSTGYTKVNNSYCYKIN